MDIEIYGKTYNVDDALKREIDLYLSLGECGNLEELTHFLTEDQLSVFFRKLQSLFIQNPRMFERLGRLINHETKSLTFLLLLCTVFKDPGQFSFQEELKNAPKEARAYYDNITRSFDTCCFFATSLRYKSELAGSDFLGRELNGRKTEFVINMESADNITGSILSLADWESQRSVYEESLGYPCGYLNTCETEGIYQIIIDGKRIREDERKLIDFGTKIHFPNGDEAGVNEFWIAGGVTLGAIFEMVIDNIPNSPIYVKKVLCFPVIHKNKSRLISDPYVVDHKYYFV